MNRFGIAALLSVLLVGEAFAEVSITIYNQDLALVRETRQLDFPKGRGELLFTDVAAQIIPTSVHFTSDKAELLEQNYEFDLVSADKLLDKYTDRQVELVTQDNHQFAGLLMSSGGDIVIKEADGGIRSITKAQIVNVHFPDLPEGLITRPTLVWLVDGKGGKGDGEISYLTNGISWEAEYVAVTDKDDENLSLTGWVNVTNNTGATYKDAKIKLMAGDVQIEQKRGFRTDGMRAMRALAVAEPADQGFQEQPFYEYHLYTLQRPSTIADKQVKQLSLFPTANTTVKKEYRLLPNADKVKVFLNFENREKVGLGMPLPKGKVRVYKQGPDGGLEFVGEDHIDHTAKDEKVRISTGNAFDIKAEKSMTDHKDLGNYDSEETWQYKLRNHKSETIDLVVEVNLTRGNWKLLDSTTPGWVKKDADTVEWTITIKPDEEKVLDYKVHYGH